MTTLREALTSGIHAVGDMAASMLDSTGGLTGQFLSTLIGAVVGAIVGGVISWCIQRSGATAARKERLAAKRQADLATAFTLMVKVIKIYSGIQNIRRSLLEAREQLNSGRFKKSEPWQALLAFATLPAEVTFTPEEAGFLLSTKVNGLILTALELSDVFNDLLQLIRLYSDRRDAMTASLPVSVMEGSLAAMDLNAKAALALAKLTTPLTSLFNGIAGRVDVDYAQAKQTFDVLRAHCVERFGTDFPKLEMIEPPAPSPSSDGATPTA